MEETEQIKLKKILQALVVVVGLVCAVVSGVYLVEHPYILDRVLDTIKSVVTQFLIS